MTTIPTVISTVTSTVIRTIVAAIPLNVLRQRDGAIIYDSAGQAIAESGR